MMKSITRFSVGMVFAGLLCFAPCAFGQGTVGTKAPGVGYNLLKNVSLKSAPVSFLAFRLGPHDFWRGDHGGSSGGCSSQDSNYRRSEAGGWRGDSNGASGCTSVPEGGTALMYVLLAGLGCLGAIAFRSRRAASLGETK